MGCYSSTTYCGSKYQEICCKPSDIEGEYCVCDNLRCVQVMPTTCISYTNQVCCFDCRGEFPTQENSDVPCLFNILGFMICLDWKFRCGCCQSIKTLRNGTPVNESCPFVMGWCGKFDCMSSSKTYSGTPVKKPAKAASARGRVDVGDLKPCIGLCCMYHSYFCKLPDAFGCYHNFTCCCLREEDMCYKPAIAKGEIFDNEIMIICERKAAIIPIKACCVAVDQVFCIDNRCAIPCDGEFVPCVLNLCYINCCFEWKPAFGCTYFRSMKQFMAVHEHAHKHVPVAVAAEKN